MNRLLAKRALDLALTVPGLAVVAPVMAGVAVAVRLTMGAPVLFRQQRPGLHGRLFWLYKFRTMRDAVDAAGRPLPDAERLVPFGRFLRSTSLDELPELLNVLKGDMSLVGPRPLLPQYLSRYTPRMWRRHDVPPGITGLAAVRGRNAQTWAQKFRSDLEYAEGWSLGLDLSILGRTLLTVLRREGISQEGQATAVEFTGNEPDLP